MSAWVPQSQLAKELGVSRRTIERWVREENTDVRLPRPHVVNKRIYFDRAAIDEWKQLRQAFRETETV